MAKTDAKAKKENQEQIFIDHYLGTMNVQEAAVKAGYSANTAKTAAYSWIDPDKAPENKQHVAAEIVRRLAERSKNSGIDAQWLLDEMIKHYNISFEDLLVHPENDDDPPPYYDLSKASREQLAAMDSLQIKNTRVGGKVYVTDIKFTKTKKEAMFKLIGDHIGVQAFKKLIDMNVKGAISLHFDSDDADA